MIPRRGWLLIAAWAIVMIAFGFAFGSQAKAHDGDPSHDEWFRSLKQPDAPAVSCCGEADAYWCDEIHVKDAKTYCTITDDRDDAPLMRPHIDIGTVIEVPDNKLKWEQDGKPIGNPTGHAIVFLSTAGYVWCFVQSSGI